jgi:hypothetical protein
VPYENSCFGSPVENPRFRTALSAVRKLMFKPLHPVGH